MNEKYQVPGRTLIQTILECRQSFSLSSDPLIPQYVRAVGTSGLCQTSDVLYVLIQNWNSTAPEQGLSAELKKPGWLSSPDTRIINDLALTVASNKSSASSTEIRKELSFVSSWIIALIGWISEDGEKRSYLAVVNLLEALGILFASIVSTEQGMVLLGSPEYPGKQHVEFTTSLEEADIPFLRRTKVSRHRRLGKSTSSPQWHISAASYTPRHDTKAFQPLRYLTYQGCGWLDPEFTAHAQYSRI